MPYDASGNWIPEKDSVAQGVLDITKANSPIVKQARQSAVTAAGRRGLLNSTIASGAGAKAAYDVAVPIATADANIGAQKNLSAQGFGQQARLNTGLYEAQKEQLGIQTGSAERIAAAGQAGETARLGQSIAATRENLGTQLTSEERRQQQQIEANKALAEREAQSRLQIAEQQIASNERLAALDTNTRTALANLQINANQTLQREQLSSEERRALQGIEANAALANLDQATRLTLAQMSAAANQALQTQQIDAETQRLAQQLTANRDLANLDAGTRTAIAKMQMDAAASQQQTQIASQERIANLDAATRQSLAALDAETQNRIANLNVSADQQKTAMSSAISYAQIYGSVISNITANPNIPAAERANLMASAKANLDANLGLVESMYNVNLGWGGTAGGGAGGTTAPAATTQQAANTAGLAKARDGLVQWSQALPGNAEPIIKMIDEGADAGAVRNALTNLARTTTSPKNRAFLDPILQQLAGA